ncbi:MAG: hypothetical protein COA74_06630 [Gammaproteobacteria bacterium]|nr:MAG: hypothetical protein COA74_06630 [Gammaproteobacteria bacterium]
MLKEEKSMDLKANKIPLIVSILLFSGLFSGLLSGCGPVMKNVTDYIPPTSDSGLECVARANDSRNTCQSDNVVAFQQCSEQASYDTEQHYAQAKDIYTEALERYIIDHEHYEIAYQEYEQQQQLLMSEGELDYIRCSKDINMTSINKFPACKKLLDAAIKRAKKLYEPNYPAKPYAPTRDRIFNRLRAKCKDTALNCDQIFNQSFRSCGGVITNRQVCISNCD